jgi:hypothetical protein
MHRSSQRAPAPQGHYTPRLSVMLSIAKPLNPTQTKLYETAHAHIHSGRHPRRPSKAGGATPPRSHQTPRLSASVRRESALSPSARQGADSSCDAHPWSRQAHAPSRGAGEALREATRRPVRFTRRTSVAAGRAPAPEA